MKIFIIPVDREFQSEKIVIYPAHHDDYGVEQDFEAYLNKFPNLVAENKEEADWCYLPIYWTRWLVHHNYGKNDLDILQKYVSTLIGIYGNRIFTVCQYADGPLIDTKNITIFLTSRKSKKGIDIPLLSKTHKKPFFLPKKKYLASFVGRLDTHPLRHMMADIFKNNLDVKIIDGNVGEKIFVRTILESYITLCPRGYGGSSFRFYESMQLGVAPLLIGDLDTRPFKKMIDWNQISMYSRSVQNIQQTLTDYSTHELIDMGNRAKKVYETKLNYGKWCKLALDNLRMRI